MHTLYFCICADCILWQFCLSVYLIRIVCSCVVQFANVISCVILTSKHVCVHVQSTITADQTDSLYHAKIVYCAIC